MKVSLPFLKSSFAILSLLFWSKMAVAQIQGGQQIFQFLDLPASARITGLGGSQLAVLDDDAGFALANPAVLNEKMNGRLVFNHNFHLADLQNGLASYTTHHKKSGLTVHAGVQYLKYGSVKQTDEFGTILGELNPKENAIFIGAGRQVYDRLRVGANLKFAQSNLGLYRSTALVGDLAALFADTANRLTVALVFKNIGGQLAFYENTREPMPFDIQIGLTKRLRHLPFRFGIVAHHLYKRDILYDDPDLTDGSSVFFGEQPAEAKGSQALDNFFRHLIFNGEFLFGKLEKVRLRFGYNHLRHQELTVPNLRSLSGFSVGFGLKISRFRLDFGQSIYHLGGGATHFGFSTNLGEFF